MSIFFYDENALGNFGFFVFNNDKNVMGLFYYSFNIFDLLKKSIFVKLEKNAIFRLKTSFFLI